jgi:glycosyltransferase involved in cell wall biosynthesis
MTESDEKKLGFAFIIPAFNEGESIASVITSIRHLGEVIVVDDGSKDDTALIASRAGATVLKHSSNKGYDLALATGFSYCVRGKFDFLITIDGDGQHDPTQLNPFIYALTNGADIVIGVRDQKQRISEIIFSLVTYAFWKVRDPLCGLKGYRISKLHDLISLYSYKSCGTEITMRALRLKWFLSQVPIQTIPRNGSSRFGSGFKANLKILRALMVGIIKY